MSETYLGLCCTYRTTWKELILNYICLLIHESECIGFTFYSFHQICQLQPLFLQNFLLHIFFRDSTSCILGHYKFSCNSHMLFLSIISMYFILNSLYFYVFKFTNLLLPYLICCYIQSILHVRHGNFQLKNINSHLFYFFCDNI